MSKISVCLISGGIDSSVTSFIANNMGYKIYALSFLYGQKHKKELRCSSEIAKAVNSIDHIIFKIDLSRFGGSSLIDTSINIPDKIDVKEIGKSIPSTYVPARNTVFLSIALSYAETINSDAIFIGATSTDYSGYPDCRAEYINAFQNMANLATKRGVEGNKIKIIAPLLYLSKPEIIKKGVDLDVPFDKTWSCYQGKEYACGKCESCLIRLKGFKDAGFKDPISYKSLPDWY
jgi:7-cyano-7-deazaguanine synthase